VSSGLRSWIFLGLREKAERQNEGIFVPDASQAKEWAVHADMLRSTAKGTPGLQQTSKMAGYRLGKLPKP
jgi:hypothetical protein